MKTIQTAAICFMILCCLFSVLLFAVFYSSGYYKEMIVILFPLFVATVTFIWFVLYKKDRAIRTRSVFGFLSIVSIIAIACMILFMFVIAPLHSHNGGVVEVGTEDVSI